MLPTITSRTFASPATAATADTNGTQARAGRPDSPTVKASPAKRTVAGDTVTAPPHALLMVIELAWRKSGGGRDLEMHQTRKCNQWYFGMKAHIGVYEFSGLVHHVKCTAANVGDVTVIHELLHGKEDCVFGDSGYTSVDRRAELTDCKAAFFIAAKRSKVKAIGNAGDRKQVGR